MTTHDHEEERPRQEEDVLPGGRILLVLAGTVAVGIGLSLAAAGLLYVSEGALRPSRIFSERQLGGPGEVSRVKGATFELRGRGRGERLNDEARQRLGEYGWVDRSRGVVRVPIDRAMELYLQRGPAARGSR